MDRLIRVAVLVLFLAAVSGAQNISGIESCRTEANRLLGIRAQVLKAGDLLGTGNVQCLVVLPYAAKGGSRERKVRRGVIVQREGSTWHELLRFDDTIRNPQGFVGIDFLDDEPTFGFLLETADERSDGTRGFTLYLTWLNPHLQPEGIAVQLAWNRKVRRFQEYAPNELDPPDFKPELRNPRIRMR